MIVYFSESDLVSFGNYMISPERAKVYLENEIIKDRVGEFLKQVNTFDIENWVRTNQQPTPPPPNTSVQDLEPYAGETILDGSANTPAE